MVAVFALLSTLLFVVQLWASPVPEPQFDAAAGTVAPRQLPNILSFVCQLPFMGLLCPSNGLPANVNIPTPLGLARGVSNEDRSVVRFAVRYANAGRWQASTVATQWQLPNNSTNPNDLPFACPQPTSGPTSEDCLSMILYVPVTAMQGKVPTLMWIHGGSFVLGSATGPGLDGSALAIATNSIIAVPQYRLGAFGFMAPSGETNHAAKDMVNALQFLKKVLPSFNGDTNKVTIAGQSSGASMVRALLAAPSASSLFRSAILQSDPMNYGFLSAGAHQSILNYFRTILPCQSSDTACLNSISTDNVLNLSFQLFSAAQYQDSSAGAFEPMRPVRDGSFINTPLSSSAPFPHQTKPILVSTVKDEAGNAIFYMNPDPVNTTGYYSAIDITFGEPRAGTIKASGRYDLPAPEAGRADPDARIQLEELGTDSLWRCPSWTFARSWAASGGPVYVGEYVTGVSYPSNAYIDYCTTNGNVCHEDDIMVVFGTAPSPTSQQQSLITEMQKRYKAFLYNGNPNPGGNGNGGLAQWAAVQGSNVHPLKLGGTGEADVSACVPTFWGNAVLYDYQLFGA